jgi:1-acyl-sn-glycerol-3-phosphate acyltransferase
LHKIKKETPNPILQKRRPISDFFYKFGSLITRIIFRLNGGLEVIGREKIPLEGGVIIAANHISYLDPPLIGSVLPRRGTFMAIRYLFDIPLLGWAMSHYAFPVDKGGTPPSVIKETIRRLKRGELIALFPEGQRSETGEILKAKRGVGMIASSSSSPVVPVLITGSNRALPYGAKWIKRAKVLIIFGKPIYPLYPPTDNSISANEDPYGNLTDKVMRLIGELQERYGDNSR